MSIEDLGFWTWAAATCLSVFTVAVVVPLSLLREGRARRIARLRARRRVGLIGERPW